MPLITTPKAGSANSNTPSRVIQRQEVSVSRQSTSSARAQALKDRLMGKTPAPTAEPIAPRPAGSSARAEEMAKLKKFNTPQPPTKQSLADIEPPPSGLAKGQELTQSNPSVQPPEKAPEATSQPLSPELAALARKERQLRKAQQEFKAQQDAWKQAQANYVPKERLTSETLKVLAEAGITPDKLVELQINQATAQDPQQILLNRIADLESQLKSITDPENGTLAKRDQEAYNSAVAQIRQDAKLVVDSNPAYGTIKSEGRTEDVVELITKVFDQEGVVLDVEEAANLVEEKLVDNLYKQYEKVSKYEKIKARLGKAAEPPPEANNAQPSPSNTAKTNTLTNAGASTRQLTPRERAILRVQEAIDRAKGK